MLSEGRCRSLGREIRALRHRFHFSEEHRAFVRIGEVGAAFLVEVLPVDYDISVLGGRGSRPGRERYFLWWKCGDDGGRGLLSMVEPLACVCDPSCRLAFMVNDEGRLLQQGV